MLEVGNVIINADVEDIITLIQEETDYCYDMSELDNDIMVTCPFHKGGMENKPSLGVNKDTGVYHCFTCGEKGTLIDLVSYTLDISPQQGVRKLAGEYIYSSGRRTLDIDLTPKKEETFINKTTIQSYIQNNTKSLNYLQSRGVVNIENLFPIGYNITNNSIILYIQDLKGQVIYGKERSISSKRFYNTANVKKSDYLFGAYQVAKFWDRKAPIWICESEIDALTCWSRGQYAVAIGGSHISNRQLAILKYLGVKVLVNGLDKDEAGKQGWETIKLFSTGMLLYDTIFPVDKKDINDLTKDEFYRIKFLT